MLAERIIRNMQMYIKKWLKNDIFGVFILNFMIAFGCFFLAIIKGNGVFSLANDFDVQQIPFYILINEAIKKGDIFYSWNVDIGSEFVGALGCYNLGSPFLWLSFLFPAEAYPLVAGWMYMIKYGIAGVTSYLWLKQFVEKRYATIGSMLYAFSGFSTVNLIFQFHDSIAFFPLLLIGYEVLERDGKKGHLAVGVLINALVNYYLFTQQVMFLILYASFRIGFHYWKHRKLLLNCMLEGILGIGMAGTLFVPSMLYVMQNPRVSQLIPKTNWIYTGNRDYLQVIRTLLFPGEMMISQSCIREYDWSSWSCYLPMISLSLVVCYILKKKTDWLAVMLAVCIGMTAIPILNSVFGYFSMSNYHRWLYMLILLMCLASVRVMEKKENYPIKWISLAMMIFMIMITAGMFWWSENKYLLIFDKNVFLNWSVCGIAGVFVTFLASCLSQKKFILTMKLGIIGFCVVTTAYMVELYQGASEYSSQLYYDKILAYRELELPDTRYRLDSTDNLITIAGTVSGTGCFTSTVSGSLYKFYENLGSNRALFTPNDIPGVKELLGAKYYLVSGKNIKNGIQTIQYNGEVWSLCENELAIPIGCFYDSYLTESEFLTLPENIRGIVMLKTLIITDDKEEIVSDVLPKSTISALEKLTSDNIPSLVLEKKHISSKLERYRWGFESVIETEKDGYAFYSVPYDKCFKVYVNGKRQEIIDSNGLMAVRIGEGVNQLRFVYVPVRVIIGMIISLVSIAIFGFYLRCTRKNTSIKVSK